MLTRFLNRISRSGSWESIALVCLITVAAFLLRVINLTSIPTGLHGDEAIVGMEGQRVLREGLLPPYSPSALGQPTAPFYLAALTVWIWDNTVFAVRISAVIFGTLTIPALYVVVRRSLGTPVALLAATFLAVMGWHIHFSRIAFPLPAWPLWVILTSGVMMHAVRARSLGWWMAAGAMSGAGMYVYNAHPMMLALFCAFAGICLALQWRRGVAETVRHAGAFAGALLASLLPMLWFVLNNAEMYWNSINRHSVRDTAAWQELDGLIAQTRYVVEQYAQFWRRLSFSPEVDYVDATGITEVVPPLMLAIALAGMIIALIRHKTPLVWLGAIIVLLMPFVTVLTEWGEMRRTLVIAPFLATFAAIGVVESVKIVRSRASGRFAWAVVALLVGAVTLGIATDLRNYFVVHADSPTQHWVFAEDFYHASIYIQGLPDDHYIYFMSDRWSFDYEPRQFLAPDARGEDRSDEFGQTTLGVDPEQGRPVFVLVGDYRPDLEALQREHPGGEVVIGPGAGDPAFIAYVLP